MFEDRWALSWLPPLRSYYHPSCPLLYASHGVNIDGDKPKQATHPADDTAGNVQQTKNAADQLKQNRMSLYTTPTKMLVPRLLQGAEDQHQHA
ncbi:hypothetical protein WJX82_005655 [Trebouxia sp. C0006]